MLTIGIDWSLLLVHFVECVFIGYVWVVRCSCCVIGLLRVFRLDGPCLVAICSDDEAWIRWG